jgi:hypothetical protein
METVQIPTVRENRMVQAPTVKENLTVQTEKEKICERLWLKISKLYEPHCKSHYFPCKLWFSEILELGFDEHMVLNQFSTLLQSFIDRKVSDIPQNKNYYLAVFKKLLNGNMEELREDSFESMLQDETSEEKTKRMFEQGNKLFPLWLKRYNEERGQSHGISFWNGLGGSPSTGAWCAVNPATLDENGFHDAAKATRRYFKIA